MSCHCLFFLCLGFLLFEKDTFPGKSPDEVAVEYQELKEPATKTNDQLIKMCVCVKVPWVEFIVSFVRR